jgi:DNA polymerase-4
MVGLYAHHMSWILHVDLDQFIAAVEVLRRPNLRGRPVIVGGSGDPTRRRQVVATASYEARAYGVRSGMPLLTAARLCPDAAFLRSDRPAYEAASARVMATLRQFPVAVEVWGWDEAYLGADTSDPEWLARSIQARVLSETGLSCSIGIGDNKLRAKMAVRYAKPAGIFRLTASNWMELLGPLPAETLWGIGGKTARKLDELGLHTVASLAAADPAWLAERLGPTTGPYLVALARGLGDTEVTTAPWVPRSRSRETTYASDLPDKAAVSAALSTLAEELAREVFADGRIVARVAVKVRYAPFFTQTRITKLAEPTTSVPEVVRAALMVLDRFELDRPVRLLGVRVEFADG